MVVRAVVLASLIGLTAMIAGAQVPPAILPDPESPFTTDGQWLYAVGEQGTAVIVRPLRSEGRWRPLGGTPFGRIIGLASASNALFVADRSTNVVTRLTPGSAERQAIQLTDVELAGVAYAGALFVVDGATGEVARVAGQGDLNRMKLRSFHGPTKTHIASDGSSLLISHPDVGDIHHVANPASAVPAARVVYRKEDAGKVILSESVRQARPFPAIRRPGPISLYRGIVYVIDEMDGKLYAMSRHVPPRPVRCTQQLSMRELPQPRTSTVLAHEAGLTVNLTGQRVENWPRIVPVELVVKATDQSLALAEIYTYLFRKGILPMRSVNAGPDLGATLEAHGVVGDDRAPSTRLLLCSLNKERCQGGQVRVPPDGWVLIPDLTFERFVQLVQSEAKTIETAVVLASRDIKTEEFRTVWGGADAIGRQNPGQRTGAANDNELLVPAEFIRYLAPMAAEDVPKPGPPVTGDELLRALEARELITILPLDEMPSAPAANGDGPLPGAWRKLQDAHDIVAKAISFEDDTAPAIPLVPIGVAEADIDQTHPDFCANAECAFAEPAADPPERVESAGDPEREPKERMDPSDHGTMVASAIAARHTRFGRKGFAARTVLHHVNSASSLIGTQIESAARKTVRIFNLSGSFPDMPKSLVKPFENDDYLFVVAAGKHGENQDGKLCSADTDIYPQCRGNQSNMIIVTSTTADGSTLVLPGPKRPGANWSPVRVDVAAPGEGFYLAAIPNTYAPADGGSSFAAPLVTATAAMLYAHGIVRPSSIRERIIATADPTPGLEGKVRGGLLNVRRALRRPLYSVLDDTLICRINPTESITMAQVQGPVLRLTIGEILRFHRYREHARVVYSRDDGVRVEDDVYFETEDASEFTCTAENGVVSRIALEGFRDYVGPAKR